MGQTADIALGRLARRPATWLWLLAAWTLPAVATATALHARLAANNPEVSWWQAFWPQLLYWYPWVLATPLVVLMAARLPLVRGKLLQRLAAHAGIAWLFGFAFQLYSMATELALFGPGLDLRRILEPTQLGQSALLAFTSVGIYAMLLAVIEAWLGHRRLAAQEQALTEARLAALQAQLRPHFLFNTLNGITALTESDPAGARAMTAKLAALLRALLDEPAGGTVPLERELDTLDRYLEIERLRFSDRLRIKRDLDPASLGMEVPPLILQPLAENAIHHGIEKRIGAGLLAVRASLRGSMLILEIADDGPGPGTEPRSGIGLANVGERLDRMYGTAARLELEAASGSGCTARLILPATPHRGRR